MMDVSPVIMYRVLSVGVRGTAMAGFSDLSPRQRWNIVAYVNTLRSSPDEVARGQSVLVDQCEMCSSGFIPVGHRFAWLAERSDEQLLALVEARDARLGLDAERSIELEDAYAVIAALRATPELVLGAEVSRKAVPPGNFRDGVRVISHVVSAGGAAIAVAAIVLAVLLRMNTPGTTWLIWLGLTVGFAGASKLANPPFAYRSLIVDGRASIVAVLTLLCAALIFGVSSWMLAQRGRLMAHRSIRGKRIAGRHGIGVWPTVMLIGTVLLAALLTYTAMADIASGSRAVGPSFTLMQGAGIGVGVACVTLLWVGFRWLAWRLPVRAFALVTSLPLYVLAVAWTGQGVHALQDAQILRDTPLSAWPTIEALGVYPSRSSVLAQGLIMLGAVLIAVIVVRTTALNPQPDARTRARTPTPRG
jgi:hypothetical protein